MLAKKAHFLLGEWCGVFRNEEPLEIGLLALSTWRGRLKQELFEIA
jgi:hypothetical protein